MEGKEWRLTDTCIDGKVITAGAWIMIMAEAQGQGRNYGREVRCRIIGAGNEGL